MGYAMTPANGPRPQATGPQSILVTGGAGFIGGHVCQALLDLGWRVLSLDNYDPFYAPDIKQRKMAALLNSWPGQLLDIHGDIRDLSNPESETTRNLETIADDIAMVIHLAAKAGVRPSLQAPQEYLSVNVDGTLSVLEWMRQHRIPKIVFASSSSVYGNRETAPFKEDEDISKPISPYAATKAMGENLLHTYSHLYGIHVVALRFFTVYGPHQRPDLAIHKFSRHILEGNPLTIYGDGSARRDFSYSDDIVQGILGAMAYDKTHFEVFNLGESETTTVLELIRTLEHHLGKTAHLDFQPPQPGDVGLTCADITKAKQHLGYNPHTPVELGLKHFTEWIKSSISITVTPHTP
jgi:UDP-glucuronate 4-epimerase